MLHMPIVLDGDRGFDLLSALLRNRIVFLGSEINDAVANIVIAQLLFLEGENQEKDISLYINSPGGSVLSGLAILDTMQFIKAPIATYVLGQAASMGAIIACSGAKGKRFILPRARFLLHQPMGGMQGQASDLEINTREILRLKEQLYTILVEQTGQTMEKIEKDCNRDFILNAKDSITYGLVDSIAEKK